MGERFAALELDEVERTELTSGLRHRHSAFPDQLDRLDLELATELPSLHRPPPVHETPNLGVHQTGSSSFIRIQRKPSVADVAQNQSTHNCFGCTLITSNVN